MSVFDVPVQPEANRMVETFSEVLAVEQLSRLIHKSPSSIRSDASRNPAALPPICRLPGNKRLLWLRKDVMTWLSSFVQHEVKPSVFLATTQLAVASPKKRGRPRKTELRSIA